MATCMYVEQRYEENCRGGIEFVNYCLFSSQFLQLRSKRGMCTQLAVVLSLAAACSMQASSAQELTFVGNQGGPFGLCQGDW